MKKENTDNIPNGFQKTIQEMDELMQIIKMQIDVLEKLGFNEKNLKKAEMSLNNNQKNKLIEINKAIELAERRQIKNSIKKTKENIYFKDEKYSETKKILPKKNKHMIPV